MKPSGARTTFSGYNLDLLSKQIDTATKTEPPKPTTQPRLHAWRDQRHVEFLRQRTLKKAVTVIRSKSKTRRLVELCEQIIGRARKSEAWLAKYEKFFRSPVWKLVSDEATRKAHFKCECWGCPGRATQAHLLEFPEEHLEPNFDWMNRNDILIALCNHHYEMMQKFVIKKIVPLDRQFDSDEAIGFPRVLAGGVGRYSVTAS